MPGTNHRHYSHNWRTLKYGLHDSGASAVCQKGRCRSCPKQNQRQKAEEDSERGQLYSQICYRYHNKETKEWLVLNGHPVSPGYKASTQRLFALRTYFFAALFWERSSQAQKGPGPWGAPVDYYHTRHLCIFGVLTSIN